VVNIAFGGLGFAADASTILEFPTEMFLATGDLSSIQENIDKLVYGLTKWKSAIEEKAAVITSKITVEGKDYQEATNSSCHYGVCRLGIDRH
jgi:hypothetical protein